MTCWWDSFRFRMACLMGLLFSCQNASARPYKLIAGCLLSTPSNQQGYLQLLKGAGHFTEMERIAILNGHRLVGIDRRLLGGFRLDRLARSRNGLRVR